MDGAGGAEQPGALEPTCRARGWHRKRPGLQSPVQRQTSLQGAVTAEAEVPPCPTVPLGKWGDSGSLEAFLSPWELSGGGRSRLYSWLERPVLKHCPRPQGSWHLPDCRWGGELPSWALVTGHLGGNLHTLWVPWVLGCLQDYFCPVKSHSHSSIRKKICSPSQGECIPSTQPKRAD